ncbi:MAG: hypothetical protein U1F87_13630 [Kiritimatiellia bacterium]
MEFPPGLFLCHALVVAASPAHAQEAAKPSPTSKNSRPGAAPVWRTPARPLHPLGALQRAAEGKLERPHDADKTPPQGNSWYAE